MNTTIVYLDDADYATQHIAALRRKDHAGQTADPRGDGGSEPRRTATDDDDIKFHCFPFHLASALWLA